MKLLPIYGRAIYAEWRESLLLIYLIFIMSTGRNLTRISLKSLTGFANSYYWPATWERNVVSGGFTPTSTVSYGVTYRLLSTYLRTNS